MKTGDRVMIFSGTLIVVLHFVAGLHFDLPSDETATVDFSDTDFYLFNHTVFLIGGLVLIAVPIIKARLKKIKIKKRMVESFLNNQEQSEL